MTMGVDLRETMKILTVEWAYIYSFSYETLVGKGSNGTLDDVVNRLKKISPTRNKSSVGRVLDAINVALYADCGMHAIVHNKANNRWESTDIAEEVYNICVSIINDFSKNDIYFIVKEAHSKIRVGLNTFSYDLFQRIYEIAIDDFGRHINVDILDMRTDEIPIILSHKREVDFAIGERLNIDDRYDREYYQLETINLAKEKYFLICNYDVGSDEFKDIYKLPLIIPEQGTVLRFIAESIEEINLSTYIRIPHEKRISFLREGGANIQMIVPNVNVLTNYLNYNKKQLCGIIGEGIYGYLQNIIEFEKKYSNIKIIPINYSGRKEVFLWRKIIRSIGSNKMYNKDHPHSCFWNAAKKIELD